MRLVDTKGFDFGEGMEYGEDRDTEIEEVARGTKQTQFLQFSRLDTRTWRAYMLFEGLIRPAQPEKIQAREAPDDQVQTFEIGFPLETAYRQIPDVLIDASNFAGDQ